MREAGLDFLITKDLDIVLIVEVIKSVFISVFWDFIIESDYSHNLVLNIDLIKQAVAIDVNVKNIALLDDE
ncbi:MAG: hypothetical protein H8E22_00945 [Candidatus Cloacimonetes bacterium]|nr:hypothetical protein [Candidatus Cloacimonadota bacterium]